MKEQREMTNSGGSLLSFGDSSYYNAGPGGGSLKEAKTLAELVVVTNNLDLLYEHLNKEVSLLSNILSRLGRDYVRNKPGEDGVISPEPPCGIMPHIYSGLNYIEAKLNELTELRKKLEEIA